MTIDGGRRAGIRLVAATLALALGACSWLPFGGGKGKPVAATSASIVGFEQAGLFATRDGRPELGVTLASASAQTVWAQVRVRSPDGADGCTSLKEIAPQARQTFTCPLRRPMADADYKVEVTPFRDATLSQPLAPLHTTLRFTPADLKATGGG